MPSKSTLVQGSKIEISSAPAASLAEAATATFIDLNCTTKEVQKQGGTKDEIDTSTWCSTAKEKRYGLADSGTLSWTGNYKASDAGYQAVLEASEDGQERLIRVTDSEGGTYVQLATVTQESWGAGVSGVWTATINFGLTGAPLRTPAGGA